jgi:phosphohistidine phosphatase
MKRLLLLRHAKASRDAGEQSDHARSLSPDGIWAAEQMAGHCAKRLRRVDMALCSSAIRTRETLRLFEQYLPPWCKIVLDDDLYLPETEVLQGALQTIEDRFEVVLLVGHEPGLSDLARLLCGNSGKGKTKKKLENGFKTASLATIDLAIERWSELQPGSGKLRAMVRPKDIR